jgi:hypothetical protein
MKITKSQLKQIIKEELSKLTEDRGEHVEGIRNKIGRLENELERINEAHDEKCRPSVYDVGGMSSEELYHLEMDLQTRNECFEMSQRRFNTEENIELLMQQLDALEGADEGGYVGELPRGS